MRSQRTVLALRYTPVSVAGGVRKAVGGFLRYVQYRDQHQEPEREGGFDAYVRYVSHRDRTSPRGRVFTSSFERSEVDRKQLVDFVTRSIKGLAPRWVQGRDGKLVDRQRAVYQFVLSPEDWRGLDLRRLARAAMTQLEMDAGVGGIGPWLAAEHRNTAHHHVHIVLAARREVAPGSFTTLVINRQRLQRMKDSIAHEVERQRGQVRPHGGRTESTSSRSLTATRSHARSGSPMRRGCSLRFSALHAPLNGRAPKRADGRRRSKVLFRFQVVARGYQLRMRRELEAEHERTGRDERER